MNIRGCLSVQSSHLIVGAAVLINLKAAIWDFGCEAALGRGPLPASTLMKHVKFLTGPS